MLIWMNDRHKILGSAGMILGITLLLFALTSDLPAIAEIACWVAGIYIIIFSALHFTWGFERSAYFLVWGFVMILAIGIGVALSITTNLSGAQNFVIIPLVILQTTGVFRHWANKIKVQARVHVEPSESVDEVSFEDFPFPQRFLVHSYIEQMSRHMKYPPSHIKNVEPDKHKVRAIVLLISTALYFGFLIFLALEIPMPGLTGTMILMIIAALSFLFIFAVSFYILGLRYALPLTMASTAMIPVSLWLYPPLSQLYSESVTSLGLALLLLLVIFLVTIFLVLRYFWRRNFDQMIIFKRKSKFIAVAKEIQEVKPYGHTAFTVNLKLRTDRDMFYEIMQVRPADMFAYRSNRWAVAGVTLDEDAFEASYLIYAHPLAIRSIERYFKHWDIQSASIESMDDPSYDQYRNLMPTLDEYFSTYNSQALVFFNLYHQPHGSAKVEFRMAFTDAKQMDEVQPLFEQEHLTVAERHEPVIHEDGDNEYGGFVLVGDIPTNVNMASLTTKRIIDLITPYGGELFRWDVIFR